MQSQYNQIQQAEFCYEIQPQFTINQKEQCNAIALNQNNQILLISYGKNIKVYQFNNGLLRCIQILPKCQYTITTLNFFNNNKQSQFISGSCDSCIIIRSITLLRNQKYIQKLNSHTRGIACLVIGQDQNMFLSGSVDQTIKLWSCYQQQQVSCQWSCQQTITDHTNDVYGLDINQKQNKAISCGYDDTIIIMEIVKQMETYSLIFKQKIKVRNFGYRILFINDEDFIFQTCCGMFLELFQLNENQQYIKTQQLPVQCKSYSQYKNQWIMYFICLTKIKKFLNLYYLMQILKNYNFSQKNQLISILLTIELQYIFLALTNKIKEFLCLQKQLKSQFYFVQSNKQ